MKLASKIGTVAVSAALVTMMAAPAFAAEVNASAPATADSTITGTIKATKISVTVPTAASFNLDPFATYVDESSQITFPTYDATTAAAEVDPPAAADESKYRIVNRTMNVPVYVAMTDLKFDGKVKDYTGAEVTTTKVALTDDKTQVSTVAKDSGGNVVTDATAVSWTNSIMFSVKKPSAAADEDAAATWLTAGGPTATAPVFMDVAGVPTTAELATAGKLDAATKHDVVDTDGTTVLNSYTYGGVLPMNFYAKAKADLAWVAGQTFTITPTFKIQTEPFTYTAVTP